MTAQHEIYKAKDGGAPSKPWPFFAVSPAKVYRSFFMDIRLLRLNKHVIIQVLFIEKAEQP